MKLKKLAAAVAVAVPVTAGLVAAQPANASPVQPAAKVIPNAYPVRCAGSMCVQITKVSGTTASIHVWDNANVSVSPSFYGHWQEQTPNHHSYNSAGGDRWWFPNQGYTFTENGGTGSWCTTQWFDEGSNYYIKGNYICVSA